MPATATKPTELTNKVKDMLVEFANEKGINLQEEFGTPAKFKWFVIGFTVTSLVNAGLSVDEAVDATLGAGTYESIATAVWNHHNAKSES